MAKLVERPERDVTVQSYLPEIWKGMKVSSRHFFRNLLTGKGYATIQYPDEVRPYAARYRGQHRLTLREDGSVRCVACYCCSTACPADCINIEAGDLGDREIEKHPVVFEIDYMKCIFCGFCEEACPQDAIRLDSGRHKAPAFTREDEVFGKVDLMKDSVLSVSQQGGNLK